MTVMMPEAMVERIRKCAEGAYPNECCGFLLGIADEKTLFIKNLLEVENAADDSRQNRYLIPAKDFFSAENSGKKLGLDIIGVYHSHPDHPAVPSIVDQENAVIDYLYLILNVTNGQAGELSGWIFNRDKGFFSREDPLIFDRRCL